MLPWLCVISVLSLLPYVHAHRGRDCECNEYSYPYNYGGWHDYYPTKDCRCPTYVFGVAEHQSSYWNATSGEFEGVFIEITRKVCEYARKSCDFSLVPRKYCWDVVEGISQALNGRWYDACIPFSETGASKAAYDFPDYSIFTLGSLLVLARNGSDITEEDLRDPTNDLKMVYSVPKDLVASLSLNMFYDAGYFIQPKNLVPVVKTADDSVKELIQTMVGTLSNCPTQEDSERVDLILFFAFGVSADNDFIVVAEIPTNFNASVMVRKDNKCMMDWWEVGYRKLICSDEYPALCEGWNKEIGIFIDGCFDRSFCTKSGPRKSRR